MIPLSTTTIAAQIRLLIDAVTDSNSDSIFRDLCQLAEYEPEGCVLLLNACFEQLKPSESQLKRDLLSWVFKYLLEKPSFSSKFCEALKTVTITEKFLEDLSNQLNLSLPEKIGASLALFDSENLELRLRGLNFCIAEIEGFCENPSDSVSNEKIQEIALFILQNDNLSKHIQTFTKIISILESKESIFLIPSLDLKNNPYPEGPLRTWEQLVNKSNTGIEKYLSEIERETKSTDILKEFGYSCMASTEHFKFALSLLNPLNDAIISKLIGTMVKSRSGLQDGTGAFSVVLSVYGSGLVCESTSLSTWDVSVFVDSVNQMVPNTNWKSVIENLDHEGFFVPDEPAFNFLMSIYTHACQDPFPLEAVFGRIWKNTEGQLSLLKYAVAATPDIFLFAHSAHLMGFGEVAHLKQGNEAWFSLDLLEVLCQLAELGHSNSVKKIIEFPITHFADVLLLGVSQIKTAYNLIQNEVLSRTFSIILRDTSKLNVISCLWRVNPMMLIRGFIETYIDPNCLTRINTVCNDLKILSMVLDTVPFCFSIRLACIASNKDQFNLEKWLTENLAVYKDIFSEECVKFLKESLSSSESSDPDTAQNTVMNIYKESGSTFLKVLQAQSGQNISEQLSDINKQLNSLYISSNSNTSSQAGTEETVSEDIEKEANKYFHQMFSGQITTDQMIQMLTHFRDSPPDKRENMIFDCMIANLFEEYKFFPKYPDKQLKLAAVLFGSLIKHHLVAHLSLGIALRGVLDALRKSVDSKMFVFGTKALEQFMDRLVEWPQYCNHILQISHLRGTHPDLVAAVERTLARVSSSQNNNESTAVPASTETSIEGSEASWQMAGTVPSQLGRQVSSFQMQQQQQQQRTAVPAAPQGFPIAGPVQVTVQRSTNQSKLQISSVPQPTVVTDPPAPTIPPKPVVTQSLLASSTSGSSTTGFSRPRNLATGVLRQTSYSSTGFGSALNIETLVAAAERRDTVIETPPSEIQDKILFMINNISTSNMEAKAKDFIDVLPEQYFPWFAQYMVMKRASIEPNFHDLYLKFVDKVNSKALNKEVLKATYENCKVLLRSELIKSSSEERSLLKNLGSWLGKFTIGRNQSLRAKEIDPKALIIEAYERGLMIAVIPFTSKILEPCHSSIAYRPPNPWTMGILSLLVEIYNLPNLKMNLKFDIEVLFKNLSWDMKEVKPASLIKDRPREIEGNPDFSNKDLISTVPQPVPPIVVPEVTSSSMMSAASHVELPPDVSSITAASRPSLPNILNQYAGPIHFSASSMAEEEKLGALIMPEQASISSSAHVSQPPPSPSPSQFSLAQLMQAIPRADTYFRINPKLAALVGPQIPLNRIIEAAMEKSVKEIVSPVIQRSVTIASRTTKEIILKDYALEPDDNIISRAAHLMVGTLSGSLAHVTCKEPLRVALTNHLRTLLQSVENNEQIIQTLITDHLDLGCALIESVATRKSVDVIDAEIGQALSQIRKQREAAGSNYYDAYTYAQGPFARVPEALRPKPGQLSHSQIRVYEDFVNVWQTPPPSQNPSPGPTSQGAGVSVASASSVAPSQLLDLPTDDFDRITAQIPSMSANEAPVTRVATPEIIPTSTESVPVTKDLVVVVPPSPAPVSDRLGTTTPEPLSTGDALERYMHVSQKLEALIAKEGRDAEIQAVVAEVPDIIRRCITRDEAALAMAQKVFRSLYENASNGVHVASYLAVLVAIRDVCKLAVKELTSWVIYSDEEKKFNVDITIGLIRSELLNLGEYNLHLAKLIDAGRNKSATEFAISLVQTLVTQESGVFISELFNVVDVLSKIANRPGSPESLQQLIEIVKNNNNGSLKEEKARQSRDKKVLTRVKEEGSSSDTSLPDPPGFQDQVAVLFTEWCQICDLPVVNDIAYNHFISQLQQNGLLKGDDITERFFRVLTELAVAHSLVNEQVSPSSISSQTHMNNNPPISYFPIDSYCKLSVVILKYASVDQIPNKAIILVKLLSVTARVLQKDAEEKKTSFNPRPYYRIFINWFIDIVSPDSDVANFPVLTCFANAFHALQPLRVPGFSYAWLELICHRNFMPKILTVNSSKGWPYFQRLVVDLFKFLDPFLRSKEIPEPVVFFYKGVLKMLLVLLHDFPEFLCDYHFSFCDVIPTTCIQLRNLILSAFPRNMRLPDPSTPNLKIDLLPEILQPPRILSDVEGALKAKQLKADIDEYLKTRNENSPFLTDLKHKLLLPQNEVTQTGTKYNVPLINSLVLYIGMQAIQQLQLQSKAGAGGPPQQMSHSPMDIFLVGAAMDVYQSLVKNLDTEGRYYLVNAICNQLRYPNNHTHYFSFVLLYLWAEATTDLIQEQITRVLLERLIVNRPHPWGLLITFIEMIKNPRYGFWNRNFTRAAPDIEKLFESVSRSCGTGPISKALEEGLASSVSDVNH